MIDSHGTITANYDEYDVTIRATLEVETHPVGPIPPAVIEAVSR